VAIDVPKALGQLRYLKWNNQVSDCTASPRIICALIISRRDGLRYVEQCLEFSRLKPLSSMSRQLECSKHFSRYTPVFEPMLSLLIESSRNILFSLFPNNQIQARHCICSSRNVQYTHGAVHSILLSSNVKNSWTVEMHYLDVPRRLGYLTFFLVVKSKRNLQCSNGADHLCVRQSEQYSWYVITYVLQQTSDLRTHKDTTQTAFGYMAGRLWLKYRNV
jgi:hypothetical protein